MSFSSDKYNISTAIFNINKKFTNQYTFGGFSLSLKKVIFQNIHFQA